MANVVEPNKKKKKKRPQKDFEREKE